MQIREAIAAGDHSLKALRDSLGIAHNCGMCVKDTRQIMDETLRINAAAYLATELVATHAAPQQQAA
ncbi:BFD-like [2Fe-2S] binding domain-containing protein [Oceanospirillum linum]|nr:BFD-like [2Fe-2S] binding domain-containing protein [Oleiphilus messinensis]SMP00435.1 BFD-like [2Fe-2S] binding domain-containing protein [Oceanospirillum linum]